MKLEVVVCRERENGEGRKMRLAWLAAGVSIGFGSRTDRGVFHGGGFNEFALIREYRDIAVTLKASTYARCTLI